MAESKHTLEIVTRTKDLASKDLARIGAEGQKAGNRVSKSLLDAGQSGKKAASIAGAGFSALAAGIGAANASSDNLGTSLISVGASVASAFATGGPAGAGLALFGVGVGVLVGELTKAEKEAEALAKKWEEVGSRSAQATQKMQEANRGLLLDLREMRAELEGTGFDRERAETLQQVNDLERQRVELLDRAHEALLDGQGAVAQQLEAEAAGILENQGLLRRKLSMRDELAAKAKREAEEAARLKEEEAAILALEQERAKEREEVLALMDKEAALLDEVATALERLTPEYEKQSEELGGHLELYRRLVAEGFQREAEELKRSIEAQKERKRLTEEQKKAEQEVAKELERQRQEQERFNKSKEEAIRAVRQEIELLDARNDQERDAILRERERQDLLARGVSERDIEELFSARRAKAARDAAESAGEEADNLERAARASSSIRGGADERSRTRRRPGSFNTQAPTFGVDFGYGRRGRRPAGEAPASAAAPAGATEVSEDEAASFRRNLEREFGIERDEHGRKLGFATGKPQEFEADGVKSFDVDGKMVSVEEFNKRLEQATAGAEQVADAQVKAADSAGALAASVEKAIPPTEQIGSGIDRAAQGFTSLSGAMERSTSSVDRFATQVESTSTTIVKALERTATRLDRLITQLQAASVLAGGL